MRISQYSNSGIACVMEVALKDHHISVPEFCGQEDLATAWGLRPVSMQEWRALWAPVQTMELLHPRQSDHTNLWRSAVIGDVIGARFATGCEMFRHDGTEMEKSGGVISVVRLRDGFSAMEFPESSCIQWPGVIMIADLKQTFRGSHHQAVVEQVMVPRASLGLANAEPFSPILIREESQRGRQFVAELDRFFSDAHSGPGFHQSRLNSLITAAVRHSWCPTSDREEWWYGRRHLIRKYIDTHLDDPNLGPLQICNLFNMSRATLYRMFEEDGGVRRRIQDRRLFSAMWDLATGGVRRGRLSQVAETWGFSSDANFNRAVKKVFGLPPGILFQKSAHGELSTVGDEFEDGPFFHWFNVERKGEPVSLYLAR